MSDNIARGMAGAAISGQVIGVPRANTLVILGSSNGAGVGASTYTSDPTGPNWSSPSTSWAGLLTAALQGGNSNWRVYNRSKSGTGTAQSIARFWTDVAPHRPSHVIICTHPLNDGLNIQTTLVNTRELVRLCRSIGAVPIVRGAYPWANPTAGEYTTALMLNRQLDGMGIWRIDHMSILDDGTGKNIGASGTSGGTYDTDGLHLNDAGQALQFSAIDQTMFLGGERGAVIERAGAWRVPAGVTSGSGVELSVNEGLWATGMKSCTIRARIKGPPSGGGNSKAFLCAYTAGANQTPLRVRTVANVYDATADGTNIVTSAIDPTSGSVVSDVVLVYHRARSLFYLYINGVLIGSSTVPSPTDIVRFGWGGRPDNAVFTTENYSFGEMNLWNVPLSGEEIGNMFLTGRKQSAGLVFDADLSGGPRTYVPNRVGTQIVPRYTSGSFEAVAPF